MFLFFFFNDTATTEIYTLSLHDALPILVASRSFQFRRLGAFQRTRPPYQKSLITPLAHCPLVPVFCANCPPKRSEEHTSELQSQSNLVCRLLLEKKKSNSESGRLQWSRH